MFYSLLKTYARLVLPLYCTKVFVNKRELLKIKGPVLFAANHPNSFLDGVILSTLLDETLYSLTRGDVFKNKIVSKVLSWLKLLPVYRTSEGVQNLAHNYTTFAACHEVFRKNKIVLIFSEASSINEWRLRPLRKGTARLAFSSWAQGLPVKVVPLAFNYDSFKRFGKEVHLNFGKEIGSEVFNHETDGKQFNNFTQLLEEQLKSLVYEADGEQAAQKFFLPNNKLKTALLFIPGIAGWLLHAPLFYLCLLLTRIGFNKSDHFDGVLTGLLFFSYPFYVSLLAFIIGQENLWMAVLILLFSPFLAWCWLQVKYLFESHHPTS